jgi:low affinity Fe/Cu permease
MFKIDSIIQSIQELRDSFQKAEKENYKITMEEKDKEHKEEIIAVVKEETDASNKLLINLREAIATLIKTRQCIYKR